MQVLQLPDVEFPTGQGDIFLEFPVFPHNQIENNRTTPMQYSENCCQIPKNYEHDGTKDNAINYRNNNP